MEKIIDPIDRELLLKELTPERKLLDTNKGGNEIYLFNAHEAPNLMLEVGRLREEAFRQEGGCSGKSVDIDEYDTMEVPYTQLIVWDPREQEIVGGYRYILGNEVTFTPDGAPVLATTQLFEFSKDFISSYLPHTLELGRSFVSVGHQSSKAGTRMLFALDNLWDGIYAVMQHHPQMLYLFGKVTVHPQYSKDAFNYLMYFMGKHFPDTDHLVWPKRPIFLDLPLSQLQQVLCEDSYDKDYVCLKKAIMEQGLNIPPMINAYMNLSPSMKYFGFMDCYDLAGAKEGGILLTFNDIFHLKRERHFAAFLHSHVEALKTRFPDLLVENVLAKIKTHVENKRSKAQESFLKKQKSKH